LTQIPTSQNLRPYCRAARSVQSLNLPANETSSGTEIIHTSLIYVVDRFVGYLYELRDGKIYLHFGDVGRLSAVSEGDINTAARSLGARAITGFQLTQFHAASLAGINVLSCY
jgi:hypothetical protein